MNRKIIVISSNALGDTLAAMPYVQKAKELWGCPVKVSINPAWLTFMVPSYPALEIVGRTLSPDEISEAQRLEYKFDVAVQEGYAKQLGWLKPEYIRPSLRFKPAERPIQARYVTIGVHSTCQAKYWNHPTGRLSQGRAPYWTELCGELRRLGYTPVVIEKHEMFGTAPNFNGLPGKSNKKIGTDLLQVMNLIHHSEFYIGLSSGMAWVAHALGKKVAMIANFTEDWNEFDLGLPDYKRIVNKNVCHGCWNRIGHEFSFDAGDWYWCPRHKGTAREFECHKSITPAQVINEIQDWLQPQLV